MDVRHRGIDRRGHGVPTFVQVLPLTDRWSTKAVSLIELSFQLIVNRRLLPLPVMTQVIVSALSGASATATGRIMSISSWLRMWQCQTYSQPKLTYWLVIGAVGLPAGSMLLKPIDASGWGHRVEPPDAVGDFEREQQG